MIDRLERLFSVKGTLYPASGMDDAILLLLKLVFTFVEFFWQSEQASCYRSDPAVVAACFLVAILLTNSIEIATLEALSMTISILYK